MQMIFTMPRGDSQFAQMLGNFTTLVGATPEAYMVAPAAAAALVDLYQTFSQLWQQCQAEGRSQTLVLQKNEAREALATAAFNQAMIIAAQTGVSNDLKLGLGIKPRASRQPTPVPTVAPKLGVVGLSGTTVTVTAGKTDKTGPRARFPIGCDSIALFTFVGTHPPADASGWVYQGEIGLDPAHVVFNSSLTPGTTVYLCGCYRNRRRETGPASESIFTNLPGGSALPMGGMKIAA